MKDYPTYLRRQADWARSAGLPEAAKAIDGAADEMERLQGEVDLLKGCSSAKACGNSSNNVGADNSNGKDPDHVSAVRTNHTSRGAEIMNHSKYTIEDSPKTKGAMGLFSDGIYCCDATDIECRIVADRDETIERLEGELKTALEYHLQCLRRSNKRSEAETAALQELLATITREEPK